MSPSSLLGTSKVDRHIDVNGRHPTVESNLLLELVIDGS